MNDVVFFFLLFTQGVLFVEAGTERRRPRDGSVVAERQGDAVQERPMGVRAVKIYIGKNRTSSFTFYCCIQRMNESLYIYGRT